MENDQRGIVGKKCGNCHLTEKLILAQKIHFIIEIRILKTIHIPFGHCQVKKNKIKYVHFG